MLVIRQAPRIHNVKSFFTPVDSRKLLAIFIKSRHLIRHSGASQVRPLQLWRGFFQSVHVLTLGARLIQNVST